MGGGSGLGRVGRICEHTVLMRDTSVHASSTTLSPFRLDSRTGLWFCANKGITRHLALAIKSSFAVAKLNFADVRYHIQCPEGHTITLYMLYSVADHPQNTIYTL